MTQSAVQKNHNSTLFCFLIICPLILYSISCPEHYFVTIGSNDSKLCMYVSGNDSKCSAQEQLLYLVPFFNFCPLIFIEHSLFRTYLCHCKFKWLYSWLIIERLFYMWILCKYIANNCKTKTLTFFMSPKKVFVRCDPTCGVLVFIFSSISGFYFVYCNFDLIYQSYIHISIYQFTCLVHYSLW